VTNEKQKLADEKQDIERALYDAYRRYLEFCSRIGHKPLGWHRRHMEKMVIEEVCDPFRLNSTVMNQGRRDHNIHISRDVASILQRKEISLDSPSVVSLWCKTCGASGRVCAICGKPDDGHVHEVSSSSEPVRLWNLCPVCVVPFQDPPEKEDGASSYTGPIPAEPDLGES
jgi:hypothetical protein